MITTSFLKVHARQSRSEKFGTKLAEVVSISAHFQRRNACAARGFPRGIVRYGDQARLLFDMASLVPAQRLAQIDQFEGCGRSPGRQPGDGFARRGAWMAAARARHARRSPPFQSG